MGAWRACRPAQRMRQQGVMAARVCAGLSVGEGELLEADGKLDVAGAHNVLDLELGEFGLRPTLDSPPVPCESNLFRVPLPSVL